MTRRRYGIVDGRRVLIQRFRGCDGFYVKWTASCSGCFESEDGYPNGDYPRHPKHDCYIGAGCRECGYRGVRRRVEWVPMDYHADRYLKAMDRAYKAKVDARRGQGGGNG